MAETKYTKEDLRRKVLEDMTVVPIGDALPGEYVDKVNPEIQSVLEYLDDEKLLIFDPSVADNVQVIHARLFQAIAELVAVQCMPAFGLGKPDQEMKIIAMNSLRRAVLPGADGTVTEACYF